MITTLRLSALAAIMIVCAAPGIAAPAIGLAPPLMPGELAGAFGLLDEDGDGRVDLDALRDRFPGMAEGSIAGFDGDANGTVQWDELLGAITGTAIPEPCAAAAEIAANFDALDSDGDGLLIGAELEVLYPEGAVPVLVGAVSFSGEASVSEEDLARFLRRCNQPRPLPGICQEIGQLAGAIPALDTDNNGAVTVEEFSVVLQEGLAVRLVAVLDVDASGGVDAAELDPLLAACAEAEKPCARLVQALHEAGLWGDGTVGDTVDVGALIASLPEEVVAYIYEALGLEAGALPTIEALQGLAAGCTGGDGVPSLCTVAERLREALPQFDTSGDGALSLAELEAVMEASAAARLFAALDRDQSGLIDAGDFAVIEERCGGNDVQDALCGMVRRLLAHASLADTNGDGAIGIEELMAVLPPNLALRLFTLLDANEDGNLTVEEAVGLLPRCVGRDEWERCQWVRWLSFEFSYLDVNEDGGLSAEEVSLFLPEHASGRLVAALDADEDGTLSPEEIEAGAEGCPGDDARPALCHYVRRLVHRFDVLDSDGNGAIAQAELAAAFPDAVAARLLLVLDLDADGAIAREELDDLRNFCAQPDDHPNPCRVVAFLRAHAGLLDSDGDGAVSLAELQALLPMPAVTLIFPQLDLNGDGLISGDDLEGMTVNCTPGEPEPDRCHLIFVLLDQFEQIDTDGDGVVSTAEIEAGFSAETAAKVILALELEAGAGITLEALQEKLHFCGGVTPIQPCEVVQAIIGYFDGLDTDENDLLSVEELSGFFATIAVVGAPVPGIAQLHRRLDLNNDGGVSLEELERIAAECHTEPPADPCRILLWFLERFDELDVNGDGELSLADLAALPAVSADGTLRPIVGLEVIVTRYDTDNSGGLSKAEIEAGAVDCIPVDPPEIDLCMVIRWLYNNFDALDADDDGELTPEELAVLQMVANPNGLSFAPLPDLARIFAKLDSDGNGGLSKAEIETAVDECEPVEPPDYDRCMAIRWLSGNFASLDFDSNGEITLEELAMLQTIAANGVTFAPAPDYTPLFVALDADASGGLSVAELAVGLESCEPHPVPDGCWLIREFANAFVKYDVNADGEITADEVVVIYGDAAVAIYPWPDFAGFIAQYDADNSGGLSVAEVEAVALLCRPDPFPDRCWLLIHFADDFASYDANGDGEIRADEIVVIQADATVSIYPGPDVAGLIAEYDSDQSGGLSQAEAEAAALPCRPDHPAPEPCELARRVLNRFAEIDVDADGVLTVEELALVLGPVAAAHAHAVLNFMEDTQLRVDDLQALIEQCSGENTEPGGGDGEEGSGGATVTVAHSADSDADGRIDLSELLRVVQIFHQGAYHCADGTEDGFETGAGKQTCDAHAADYQTLDFSIDLRELLRVIQLANSAGGAYHADAGSEDGFASGTETSN
ncbi:MAG: hypothetical protein HYV27_02225 [Candidatus Hydrogenedentes bacterium]|nr:hypothetical protein [Candidatus Hydrogenedentota bacterium]